MGKKYGNTVVAGVRKPRRNLFGTGLALLALGATLTACGSSTPSASATTTKPSSTATTTTTTSVPHGGTVIFAGFGSTFEKTVMQYIAPGFEQKYGINVKYVPGTADSNLSTIQASKSNPTADVYWGSTLTQYQGMHEGLFAPLSKTAVPNLKLVNKPDLETGNVGVGVGNYAIGIEYNTKDFATNNIPAPTSWKDFWNPAVKGHVALNAIAGTYAQVDLPEIAKTWGGSVQNMQPLWNAFSKLKPSIVGLAATPAELNTFYQQGQAWISDNSNIRAFALAATGVPVKWVAPKTGAVAQSLTLDLVKGAPDAAAGQAWINYLLSPNVQKIFAEKLGYAPVISGVKLSATLLQETGYTPTAPSGTDLKTVPSQTAAILQNLTQWTQAWTAAT